MSEKAIVKRYGNGEITVVWKPGVCIHSTYCDGSHARVGFSG